MAITPTTLRPPRGHAGRSSRAGGYSPAAETADRPPRRAVARRPGQQPHLAGEVLGRGQVDRLAQGHAQRGRGGRGGRGAGPPPALVRGRAAAAAARPGPAAPRPPAPGRCGPAPSRGSVETSTSTREPGPPAGERLAARHRHLHRPLAAAQRRLRRAPARAPAPSAARRHVGARARRPPSTRRSHDLWRARAASRRHEPRRHSRTARSPGFSRAPGRRPRGRDQHGHRPARAALHLGTRPPTSEAARPPQASASASRNTARRRRTAALTARRPAARPPPVCPRACADREPPAGLLGRPRGDAQPAPAVGVEATGPRRGPLVAHLDHHLDARRRPRSSTGAAAVLDRVGQQVAQHLGQPPAVGPHRGRAGLPVQAEPPALPTRHRPPAGGGGAQRPLQGQERAC